jgi:hypothetical protein
MNGRWVHEAKSVVTHRKIIINSMEQHPVFIYLFRFHFCGLFDNIWLSSIPVCNLRDRVRYLQLGNKCFFPNPYQFIILYHPYNWPYRVWVNGSFSKYTTNNILTDSKLLKKPCSRTSEQNSWLTYITQNPRQLRRESRTALQWTADSFITTTCTPDDGRLVRNI